MFNGIEGVFEEGLRMVYFLLELLRGCHGKGKKKGMVEPGKGGTGRGVQTV